VGADDDAVSSDAGRRDTPAEVDATAATQRRTALAYGSVFLLGTLAVPLLSSTLPWWSEARLLGGLSPNFVTAAGGLYVFFAVLGVAAASLATAIEDRMLGDLDDRSDPS
jgi:hypothetical protein